MHHSKYVIVGSSHAGLAALDAIRLQDKESSLTLVTQEACLPYSPTILPYLLSGQTEPDKVYLRSEESFRELKVSFKPGVKVVAVEADNHRVVLGSGEILEYEKLLLATGAAPKVPPVEGLQGTSYHVLRTLEDAMKLRAASREAKTAVILGGGLIGLHAAESLAARGLKVTVVEALSRLLSGYFEEEAASLICGAFRDKGIEILTLEQVLSASEAGRGCLLNLASGKTLSADLILIATGVRPRIDCLAGSEVKVDEGILVDERMRTSAEDIWAAGDAAQAGSFFDQTARVNAILPSAVEQGRIAGMDMVDDPALKLFSGNIPLNSCKFFGHRAFSVGMTPGAEGVETEKVSVPEAHQYLKLVFRGDYLAGAEGVNSEVDPGVMHQLIRRKVVVGEEKAKLCANPVAISRVLMTSSWR
jgi:phenylglyoxylate dehydrogenase epsilon subunit